MSPDRSPTPDPGRLTPYRPRGAVYVSTAGAMIHRAARGIGAELNAAGLAVFLDEESYLDPDNGELQIIRAVAAADHVLVHLTPTPGSSMYPGSSGTLDRRYFWLSIGAGYARGIPITVLPDGIERHELNGDENLKNIHKLGRWHDLAEWPQYMERLRTIDRSLPHPSTGAGTSIQLCFGAADRRQVARIRKELTDAYGIECHEKAWGAAPRTQSRGQHHDPARAVAVFFGKSGFPAWGRPDFDQFLGHYASLDRPIILISLPGSSGVPAVPADVRKRAVWIDAPDPSTFPALHVLWAACGYRVNDPVTPRPEPVGTKQRTVLRVAAAGAVPHAPPRSGDEARALDDLYVLIRAEVRAALVARRLQPDQVAALWTADGAVLLLDTAEEAHEVAAVLGERGRGQTAMRFRMGAASGPVERASRAGGDQALYGAAVSLAIRLQATADPCSLVVDTQTFDKLPTGLKQRYARSVPVPGAEDQALRAPVCEFVALPPVTPPTPPTPDASDRREPFELLRALYGEGEMNLLMYLLGMPNGSQPPKSNTADERHAAILQWSASPGGPGLPKLAEEIRYLVGQRR